MATKQRAKRAKTRKPRAKGKQTLRRIRVAEVKAAYKVTRLRPVRGDWVNILGANREQPLNWDGVTPLNGTACALGAVAVARTMTKKYPITQIGLFAREYLGLAPAYLGGFLNGFDGDTYRSSSVAGGFGYHDGKSAARAMFPKAVR